VTSQERYAHFRPAFAEALDPRLYNIEHLDRILQERWATIFFSANGAIVAGIKTFPTGARALEIVIATGPQAELVDELYPQVETWGRQHGCSIAIIESRPGWAKVMKRQCFETFQVSIIKEL
jgi:hypothetical protein